MLIIPIKLYSETVSNAVKDQKQTDIRNLKVSSNPTKNELLHIFEECIRLFGKHDSLWVFESNLAKLGFFKDTKKESVEKFIRTCINSSYHYYVDDDPTDWHYRTKQSIIKLFMDSVMQLKAFSNF